MRRRIMVLVATALTATMMVVGSAGAAFAVGGPNEAGNSGQFHPKNNPCKANADHPHCPGRH